MKTELEKCLSGEWYDCHAPVFMEFKRKTHELLLKYNSLPYDCKEEKYVLLKEMFESVGEKVSVGHSFICDYGCNIYLGKDVMINYGCVFLDVCEIKIGDNTLIGPHTQIYTACHSIDPQERLKEIEFGKAVTIGNNVWIGGNCTILPGVTIGDNSVIGAGSVVTKDVPANVLAYGNPCQLKKKI